LERSFKLLSLWFNEVAPTKNQREQELEMDFKLSRIRAEAKRFSYTNDRARIRFLALIELCKRSDEDFNQLKEVDYESVGARFKCSGRSVQRWLGRYLCDGPQGLIARKAPGRKPTPLRGHSAKLILDYRQRFQWGAQLIHVHLKAEHGISIGVSRIQEYLRKKGLLRRRKSLKRKKHTRKVVVRIPGAHTQIDVKYFPRRSTGEPQLYVYNFRDHATRWTYKRAYASIGAWETVDFFKKVIELFPGKIWSVQTDNGSEFTNRYLSHIDAPKEHPLDRLCREHGIRHRLIPVGEKELQGLVERSHREDDEELYHRIRPRTAEQLNTLLEPHCEWANRVRRRAALAWQTAAERMEHFQENTAEYESDLAILQKKLEPWIRTASQG
jgi:transposase